MRGRVPGGARDAGARPEGDRPLTLQPDRTLSHYRLVEKIGEGGMGVVWKALDTTLDREVAVKVLPETFSGDPDRVARFEREAKLLASLNHPNIATLHGFDRSEKTGFLVMEFVPGESLARRIGKGPIPLEEALPVLLQISEGLEAAHEKGVIHRDLKPANIRLTPEGRAKILDFGLAKAFAAESEADPDASRSPTLTAAATQRGEVMGTAAYMSPEQARGRPVDRRADIWAFGCVLYEVLAGRRVFTGETVSDTLAAVLRGEPEWEAIPAGTPAAIRTLLRRCLDRDPKRRLRDIGEARVVIQDALGGAGEEEAITAAPAEPARRARPAILLAAGVVLGAALASLVAWSVLAPSAPAESPLRKFELEVENANPSPVISPDGGRIAYSEGGRLWIRDLDHLEPREIPGSDGGAAPFWSPGGDWLGYSASGRLWKVPSSGGEPAAISDLPQGIDRSAGGAAWGADGTIVFTTGNTGLLRVPAQGGDPEPFLEPGSDEVDFHNVSALPGGRGWLFVVHAREGSSGETLDLYADGERKEIHHLSGQVLFRPVYAPTGHILYRRFGTNPGIWALPFSLSSLEATGRPFLVAAGGRSPSVASDGTLVYVGSGSVSSQLVWVDREGNVESRIGEPQRFTFPALSPDGRRVAVVSVGGSAQDIWTYDVATGARTRLTFEEGAEMFPAWSPDGKQIVYTSGAQVGAETVLKMKASDGSGEWRELVSGFAASFSPDGRFLAYVELNEEGSPDLMCLPLDGEGEPRPLLRTEYNEMFPQVSPDGRYVAYQSNESGTYEIYLTGFPVGEGKWQVSVQGGLTPRWSRSGDEIFFFEGHDMMAVQVATEPSLRLGTPRRLFTHEPAGFPVFEGLTEGFDVSSDGERLVMVTSAAGVDGRTRITVVQNWFAEFRERE